MIQQTFNKKEKEYWIEISREHPDQGCFMQSDENVLSTTAKTMNIPEWLVRVSEKIFEGLSQEESLSFPVELLEAIPENSDLTKKWKEWNYSLMMDEDHGQYNYAAENVECQDAIKGVADLFLLDVITYEAAAAAANLATDSVSALANSAARSATAAAAAVAATASNSDSVYSTAAVADSVASAASNSVYLAADSVARSDSASVAVHYTWMKTNLIEILKS